MKKPIVFASMAFFALSAFGAPAVFNVEAPGWSQIAVATTDGVNVRKSPSTTAPRLMYDEMSIEDYDLPLLYSAFWSSKAPSNTLIPIAFNDPTPIVSEKEGWYEVLNYGPERKENGWVSSKFTKAVAPEAFGSQPGYNYMWIDRGADGVYMVAMDYNEMNGDVTFYVGRLVDGVVVSPYELYCPIAERNDSEKSGLKKIDDYYSFTYDKSLAGTDFEYEPSIQKFPAELLESIVENAQPAERPVTFFLYDGNLYRSY